MAHLHILDHSGCIRCHCDVLWCLLPVWQHHLHQQRTGNTYVSIFIFVVILVYWKTKIRDIFPSGSNLKLFWILFCRFKYCSSKSFLNKYAASNFRKSLKAVDLTSSLELRRISDDWHFNIRVQGLSSIHIRDATARRVSHHLPLCSQFVSFSFSRSVTLPQTFWTALICLIWLNFLHLIFFFFLFSSQIIPFSLFHYDFFLLAFSSSSSSSSLTFVLLFLFCFSFLLPS